MVVGAGSVVDHQRDEGIVLLTIVVERIEHQAHAGPVIVRAEHRS